MSPSSSAARTCAFGPPADHLLLDLVVPDGDAPASGRPVVVWLHGGGWRLQDRTACPDLSRHFAARGLAMVSIDYRLAPTHRHPVQVIDLRRALRFLRANASELSLDPDRIGLWGSSAGGHVASMAALLGRQPALPGELATADDLSWPVDVACVVEGYGPAALADLLPPFAPTASGRQPTPEEDLLGGPASSVEDHERLLSRARDASPVEQDAHGAPPFLVLHGLNDQMVPATQSIALHEHLAAAGVDSSLLLIEGFGHGFLNPGDVAELGPGIRLDNGRLERELDTAFAVRQTPDNPFAMQGRSACLDTIGDFFTLHLQHQTNG